MRRKLRDTGGFSFVETLCAMALLVLLCMMMYTGIQMALKTYREITAESELRLLRSSLSDVLTDRLRYASVTGPENAGVITPRKCTFGTGIGAGGRLTGVAIDGEGMLKVDGKRVLSDGAYGEKIFGGNGRRYRVEAVPGGGKPLIRYEGGNVFKINFTVTDTRTHISQTAELTVRCLNPVKKEGTPP